jgi:hypothetical protein
MATEMVDPDELRDARFADLCRHPATDEATALVDYLYTRVLGAEAPRERQRVTKADALRAAVAGFVADLLSAAQRGDWVYRPTNTNFYTGGPVSARTFTALRVALRTLGLIEEKAATQQLTAFGFGRGYAVRFRATPALEALAGEHGIQLAETDKHFPLRCPRSLSF